jgi:hypothetical protein
MEDEVVQGLHDEEVGGPAQDGKNCRQGPDWLLELIERAAEPLDPRARSHSGRLAVGRCGGRPMEAAQQTTRSGVTPWSPQIGGYRLM